MTNYRDRPTWSGIDQIELTRGPSPDSLPPTANEAERQWAWLRVLGRAHAAVGESLAVHREEDAKAHRALRRRLRRLEEAAIAASARAGRSGRWTSIIIAVLALLTAIGPKLLAMIR